MAINTGMLAGQVVADRADDVTLRDSNTPGASRCIVKPSATRWNPQTTHYTLWIGLVWRVCVNMNQWIFNGSAFPVNRSVAHSFSFMI